MKIVLAGQYPDNTFKKIKQMLSKENYSLVAIEKQDEFDRLTDADIIILRSFKAPKEIIANNKHLKMIMRWGTGFDSVDIKAAGIQGVLVTNTPGANSNAVSELAILLMLAVGRKLLCHIDSLREGKWSKNIFLDNSFCMRNKIVGIIGAGNIGRKVATKAQAFGASTLYYDPFRLSFEKEKEYGLKFMELPELIATSDIITLHIPLTNDNKHMIGEPEIANMKQGAILINTSRGGLVDDKALLNAVENGKLAGAGLDVVENEPLLESDPLIKNSNIIVTPHIGGGTADIADAIIPMLVNDIKAHVDGREIEHLVNKEFLKK
jgi:D-3-phosphoglycerate dehydrogenase